MVLMALMGVGLLHSTVFTDLCLRYVKEGLRPLLIVSGVLLLLLALADAVMDKDPGEHHSHAHGHHHNTAPRIAWLLFLPALSLVFYAPPALGAYTAARSSGTVVEKRQKFDSLPATSPLPMTLTDFTARVQQDREAAVKGRVVQLTGFVTPVGQSGAWDLTRIIFTCCAADARTVKVRVYGTTLPPANTWLAVTGTWHPGGRLGTKSAAGALDVRTIRRISPPVNAYTDDLPLVPS
jgi:uncharacterized repeat protein (TIGR03943 family)